MLLSEYLGLGSLLDHSGVFDPDLKEDSHFFINIQRKHMSLNLFIPMIEFMTISGEL